MYYFNISTNESVWEKPKDFKDESSTSVCTSENVICTNSQRKVENSRINIITNYTLDQHNKLATRNNPYHDESVIYGLSKRDTKLLNEEDSSSTNKNSQTVRNLTDNSNPFGFLNSSKIVNLPTVNESAECKMLQYREHTANNKRMHIEDIISKLEGHPKKSNTVDKEELDKVKDNDHLQHASAQGKLTRKQRKVQKRCKRTKKKKLSDLRTKLKTNLTAVQSAGEKSDPLNYTRDTKLELESLDVDQIHKSIICARKEIKTESVVSSEMEWITSCADQIEFESRLYIVLDTNVLVTSITFIKKLQNMSGNGCPLLLVPYQVLLELDHLKQRKSSAGMGARQAIDVIYKTFKTGSPRIRGQSASEAQDFSVNLDKNIPDDAIINCCLQQIKKGNDVVLLTRDKNLSSKAFMNGVKVYSVYDMARTISDANKTSVSLKQAIFGDETMSAVVSTKYVVTQNVGFSAEMPSTAAVAGNYSSEFVGIINTLKDCLFTFVNNVLQRGMFLRYGQKWECHCSVKPPWNLQRGLKCLCHQWYTIMESFEIRGIKSTIMFLQKTFSRNDSSAWTQKTVMEVLEASSHLSSVLSAKYTTLASNFHYTINELRSKINEQPIVDDVNSIEPVGTDEQALVAVSAFGEMWPLLWGYCTSLYIALGWDELQNPVASLPSLEEMKPLISVYYTTTLNLLQAASGILEADLEELTVTHPSVVLLHSTVYGFLEKVRAPLLYDVSVQNILAFSTRQEYRDNLRDIISPLEELSSKFMKCVDHFVKVEGT